MQRTGSVQWAIKRDNDSNASALIAHLCASSVKPRTWSWKNIISLADKKLKFLLLFLQLHLGKLQTIAAYASVQFFWNKLKQKTSFNRILWNEKSMAGPAYSEDKQEAAAKKNCQPMCTPYRRDRASSFPLLLYALKFSFNNNFFHYF